MTTPAEMQSATILYTAAASQFGITVLTDDVIRARQMLWRFRKKLGDPTLANLQIRLSPDNANELWLVHMQEADTSEEPQEPQEPQA